MVYLNIIGVITCVMFVWAGMCNNKILAAVIFATCLGINLAWVSLSLFPPSDKCTDKPTLTMTRHEL